MTLKLFFLRFHHFTTNIIESNWNHVEVSNNNRQCKLYRMKRRLWLHLCWSAVCDRLFRPRRSRYYFSKEEIKPWSHKWVVRSCYFLSFWGVYFDAVFNSLLACLFPIKLRRTFGNLVSFNIDWVLKKLLKVLWHILTPLFEHSYWPKVVWKMFKHVSRSFPQGRCL